MIEDVSFVCIVNKFKLGLEVSNGIFFFRKLLYKKIFCLNESCRKNINLDFARFVWAKDFFI